MTIGMRTCRHGMLIVLVGAVLLLPRPAFAQVVQQGPKLVSTECRGCFRYEGWSVSISGDGNTAVVGSLVEEDVVVWVRSGGVWSLQGPRLVGPAIGNLGAALAISADGNTIIAGAPNADEGAGAAVIWTRTAGVWTQQGSKLLGSGAIGKAAQGASVSISADGNTAIVGGPGDNAPGFSGAVWVWTRTGGMWTQQGPKLVGSGAIGNASQGVSVSISADGNTAVVGGPSDNPPADDCCSGGVGAAWIWTRSGGAWTQQGPRLVGSGAVGSSWQGESVSLSADGNTAIVGGPSDNLSSDRTSVEGAAWVWQRSGGVWSQQGGKLLGSGAVGGASQGSSVSLSADGNTAIIGGPDDGGGYGAAWLWTKSGDTWTQRGAKFVGTGAAGGAAQGRSVSLSGDGTTVIVGGPFDDIGDPGGPGAAWVFVALPSPVSPLPDMDGDGTADLALWRGSTGRWLWLTTASGFNSATAGSRQWGNQDLGDLPLTGDIDGDGIADLMVWRASTGTWFWLTSSTGFNYAGQGQKQWGATGDIPIAADIDGDGRVDLVVWRPSTGTWFWLTSSSGYNYASAGSRQWGNTNLGDVPLAGHFDGDGKADLAIWRASTGTWYWLTSSSGYNYASAGSQQWGNLALGDVPLLADFDGDRKADLGVWRASTGTWYWLRSSSAYAHAAAGSVQWGNASLGDTPLVGDIDGDGRTDPAVWRASTGTWFWLTSSSGYATQRLKQWP
jgi:hypothetical protein